MADDNATKALEEYLSMNKPGYAIMIDAPWGAGKTHFVKSVCSDPETSRYISLNGVANEEEFRRTLVRSSPVATFMDKGVVALASSLGEHLKLRDLGGLAQGLVEEKLLQDLPETLIFDDLERCDLEPAVLLGKLNEFLEHQDKRVVLLVHSEEIKKKDAFLSRCEKIVGRTIRIQANFEKAYKCFLGKMDEGLGRAYLKEHEHVIKKVFDEAGHQNLRLVRNGLRDLAIILDKVREEHFEAKEPMTRFVGTYMAFSMALARNDISVEELKRRSDWNIFANSETGSERTGLASLYKQHPTLDILDGGGGVMPAALCQALFKVGFVDTDQLNVFLAMTGQFVPQEEYPLWKRMYDWADMPWDEITVLIQDAEKYLFHQDPINPGAFLHIAGVLLGFEARGVLEAEEADLKARVLGRIEDLLRSDKIPPAVLGVDLSWVEGDVGFSYGGYRLSEISSDFQDILAAMSTAQFKAYEGKKQEDLEDVASRFEQDLRSFLVKISSSGTKQNYSRIPFLHELDVERFSKAFLMHLENGKATSLGSLLKEIAERHSYNEDWSRELEWLALLKSKLQKGAADHSKIAADHLRAFLAEYWKFGPVVDVREENA